MNSKEKSLDAKIDDQIKLAYAEWQIAKNAEMSRDVVSFMKETLIKELNLQNSEIDVELDDESIVVTINKKDYIYDTKIGIITSEPTVLRAKPGEVVPEGRNAVYKSNGKKAIIPSGYTVSMKPEEQSIDTGLVIEKNGNEWVWIPVSSTDFIEMFGTANNDGWIMCGTEIKTKYKANSNIISEINRTDPGLISTDVLYREPDVLNNDSYDKNITNLSEAGLGENINEMATNLRNDYKNMMDSVKKNGGFYVGRFELSNAGTKKDQKALTNKNWYNLYAKCITLESDSAISRMIWGCQWDQVCKFISSAKDANGEKISLIDSRKYGNYSNSEIPANTNNGSIQNTGSNEAWKTNNIYDLAGNCWELTQEACSGNARANRGGCCGFNGEERPVFCRDNNVPTSSSDYRSTRPVLYVK